MGYVPKSTGMGKKPCKISTQIYPFLCMYFIILLMQKMSDNIKSIDNIQIFMYMAYSLKNKVLQM